MAEWLNRTMKLTPLPFPLQCVYVLCDLGCNPDARNNAGEPPLHIMVAKHRNACVMALLNRGAQADLVATSRHTNALHLAVEVSQDRIAGYCIPSSTLFYLSSHHFPFPLSSPYFPIPTPSLPHFLNPTLSSRLFPPHPPSFLISLSPLFLSPPFSSPQILSIRSLLKSF